MKFKIDEKFVLNKTDIDIKFFEIICIYILYLF